MNTITPVPTINPLRQHTRKATKPLYMVEYQGEAEYLEETLAACYRWIALKMRIPEKDITLNQAIQAGYRIRVM